MSKSATYRERERELGEKESLLLDDLNQKNSKVKKILIWSLAAGLVGLVFYGFYRSFTPSSKSKKKKKVKKNVPGDYPIVDSALEQIAPRIGKWILKEFG